MRILLIFFLIAASANGQITKLTDLSLGKYLDSEVIMQDDESDVYGYCMLYETNRQSREVFQLEYVILDKNLNRLTSISLTQAVFKSWAMNTKPQITFLKKIGNELIIAVHDKPTGELTIMSDFNFRFIKFNLADFSASKEFKYEGFTKKELSYNSNDEVKFADVWNCRSSLKLKPIYFWHLPALIIIQRRQ